MPKPLTNEFMADLTGTDLYVTNHDDNDPDAPHELQLHLVSPYLAVKQGMTRKQLKELAEMFQHAVTEMISNEDYEGV